MMNLIEHQPHFWELYQDFERYYLSIAVDMSSVVSCWDLALTQDEILAYEQGVDFLKQILPTVNL